MHILRDGQTCVPQLAWLDPELRRFLPALTRMAVRLEAGKYECISYENDDERMADDWLQSHPIDVAGAACLPFFSEEYCDKLVAEADDMALVVGHTPNPDEEEAYQIPELVLHEVCPSLFAALSVFKERVVDVYSRLLWGSKAEAIRSIQFARYEAGKTEHGNWHHDSDSDVTAVVSLQPECFTGGGTDIRRDAFEFVTIEPLPKGHCLLFNGKHTLHRGRRVETGRRDLLVFWNEYE